MLEPGVLDDVLELRQRLDRDVVPAGRQAGAETEVRLQVAACADGQDVDLHVGVSRRCRSSSARSPTIQWTSSGSSAMRRVRCVIYISASGSPRFENRLR
jgi:hypothetical protein